MDEIKHLKLQLLYMSNMLVKHCAFLLFSATSCQKSLCLCVEIMSHSGSDAVHLWDSVASQHFSIAQQCLEMEGCHESSEGA